jgi:hypothetical protein
VNGESDESREFETNTKMNVDDGESNNLGRNVEFNSATLLTNMKDKDEESAQGADLRKRRGGGVSEMRGQVERAEAEGRTGGGGGGKTYELDLVIVPWEELEVEKSSVENHNNENVWNCGCS